MPELLDQPLLLWRVTNSAMIRRASSSCGTGASRCDALLFECAHETFGHTVAYGPADGRGRDRAPKPLHLIDPGMGDVLLAPVAPQGQSPRHVLAESPEGMPDALPNRLERGP